jgi:hypothetical protein
MTDRPGLTQEEQEAIAAHARRLSAYVELRRLIAGWTAELALQDKADRVAARTIGGLVSLAIVAAWLYLLWRFGHVFVQPTPSPIHAARLAFWYPAGMAALVPFFCIAFSYAIYRVVPAFEKAMVYALFMAVTLFFVGLLVAPLVVWALAS